MHKDEIISAVRTATTEVFSTMVGIEAVPLDVHADESCPPVNDGVMSIVGIAGPWVGNGMLSCSAAFACRVCELFLMTEAPTVNDEVLDAVGELANMIIGNFKTTAEAVVGPLGLSVPTVIYGQNFTSKSLGTSNWLVMPFQCGDDKFEVRVWFAPASVSATHRHPAAPHLQAV
jgi:chemotaxis protein CheX